MDQKFLLDRYVGSLLGMAAGDAYGMPANNHSPYSVNCLFQYIDSFYPCNKTGRKAGSYSGVTQLALLEALSLIENKDKVTGASLIFIDEGADTGPIILQQKVKVENDTVDSNFEFTYTRKTSNFLIRVNEVQLLILTIFGKIITTCPAIVNSKLPTVLIAIDNLLVCVELCSDFSYMKFHELTVVVGFTHPIT